MGDGLPRAMERRRRGRSLQNLVARTCVSPFRPCSPHVVSFGVEVGRKGESRPTPSFTFVGLGVEVGLLPLRLLFLVLEVAALYHERGFGLLPCCLVPWCRLGLRPLLGTRIFCCWCSRRSCWCCCLPPLRFRNLPLRGACSPVLLMKHRALP